jgi:hypothetical protein
MSQSTNAILFFGYCWHDEETLPDVEDFIECILKDRGMKNPYDNYPEAMIAALASYQAKEALGKKWREENNESIDAWFNAKAVIREELTCSIGSHCSGGCSRYFLPSIFYPTLLLLDMRLKPQSSPLDNYHKDFSSHDLSEYIR